MSCISESCNHVFDLLADPRQIEDDIADRPDGRVTAVDVLEVLDVCMCLRGHELLELNKAIQLRSTGMYELTRNLAIRLLAFLKIFGSQWRHSFPSTWKFVFVGPFDVL